MNGSSSNTSGANVATREWTGDPKHVSKAAREEIARDLQITFEQRQTSDIWDKAAEPTDKTLIWWPKDPTSGTRIGRPQTYDSATSKWVALGGEFPVPVPARKRVNGSKSVAAGASIAAIDFAGFNSAEYFVKITPSTKQADGTFAASPANMNNFGYCLVAQSKSSFSIQLFAVPTGGFTLLWEIEELEGATV